MAEITFLGSGGGRFTTVFQERSTGGIYLNSKGGRFVIDPGPGSLSMMRRLNINPTMIHGVFVSHCHPDHYSNAEVLIEGMTKGGRKKRGIFAGSISVLEGADDIGPAISEYHKGKPARVETLKRGKELGVSKDLKLKAGFAKHSDPTTVGMIFETENIRICYMADTAFDPALLEDYGDPDMLVLPVTRPLGARIPHHLCTEDASVLVRKLKPRIAVLTHFGIKMLRASPVKEARWITSQTGIRTLDAVDGLHIDIGRSHLEIKDLLD